MSSKLLISVLLVACIQAAYANCQQKSFVYQREYENTRGEHCEFAPANWAEVDAKCRDVAANRPSPINIGLAACKAKSAALKDFQFGSGWNRETKFTVKNNGHSIQADALNSKDLTVTGGNLKGTYDCVQFHFHWGSASKMQSGIGSEHRMTDANGKPVSAPMEVHIVCKRQDLSFQQAANTPDAVAVLGAFIQVQMTRNLESATSRLIGRLMANMNPLYAPVPHGKSAGGNQPVVDLVLRDLLPTNLQRYVNYDGALTTPGCNPVVQFHIFVEPVSAIWTHIEKFTKVFFDEAKKRPMVDNFRPVMGLHGRQIRCSFAN